MNQERIQILVKAAKDTVEFYASKDMLTEAIRSVIIAAINETKEEDRQIVLKVYGGPSHKCSENSDRYRIQDETVNICATAILASKIKE